MSTKDIICPFCLHKIPFQDYEYDSYKFSLGLNEDIKCINFNNNNNDIIFNINFDSKFENIESEQKKINSNCIDKINKPNPPGINSKNSMNNSNIDKGEIKNDFNSNKYQKKLGRKFKRKELTILEENDISDNNIKVHDKFADDNIRKKVKNIILKNLFEFINYKIKTINNNHWNSKKRLFCLKAENKNTNSLYLEFMNKSLKDIFSQEISERCSHYSKFHNKEIIETLINDKNEYKKNYFTKLFSLTFLDCLKYFRGDKGDKCIKELDGFKTFSSVKEQLLKEHGKEYVNHFEEKIQNLEELIDKRIKKQGKDFEEIKND